jgi:hypothetical protein
VTGVFAAVTTDRATLHFCEEHKPYAFTIAVVNAETLGKCRIFVPDFGGFEPKASGPRVNPPDENEDEED